MVRFVAAFHLLVLIGFLSSRSESLRFDLQSGHTKCISEDIKQNAMTVGKYHVVNPNEGQPLTDERKLIVRVFVFFFFCEDLFIFFFFRVFDR